MDLQRLVCASCAGPVTEGRCAQCRRVRDGMHFHLSPAALAAVLVALFLAVLAVLAGVLATAARATA